MEGDPKDMDEALAQISNLKAKLRDAEELYQWTTAEVRSLESQIDEQHHEIERLRRQNAPIRRIRDLANTALYKVEQGHYTHVYAEHEAMLTALTHIDTELRK